MSTYNTKMSTDNTRNFNTQGFANCVSENVEFIISEQVQVNPDN